MTATQEIHEQVAKLIEELDQPSPSKNAVLTPIELGDADANYVESKIEDLFSPSARSSGGFAARVSKVPVNVVAEPVSNRG